MITPTSGNADHGYHMPPAQADAERIDWRAPQAREQRRRTLRWTCQCRSTVYYLVAGGAHMYIARVDDRGRDETERMPYAQAEQLWTALMTGKAI